MSIGYGRYSGANRDSETGIRYGVYSLNALPGWIWDCLEAVYTESCPRCGGTIDDENPLLDPSDRDDEDRADIADELGCTLEDLEDKDTLCPHCYAEVSDDEICPDEADYHTLKTPEGIIGQTDRDCTILRVFKSPYIGRGDHCSPCVPGAINEPRIGAEGDDEAYCLPDSYFEDL
jgi:hypothetical protein